MCEFWFNAAFKSFLVISRRCLVATGRSVRFGGSHFYTYNSGFPCAFICLSFMLMAVDFSRTQKGYSVHLFNLYYIVIDLEAGQYFVGRFQNLDYMHYWSVHFTGDVFFCCCCFNLSIESTTKYFLLSGFVIQLLKINLWHRIDAISSMFH